MPCQAGRAQGVRGIFWTIFVMQGMLLLCKEGRPGNHTLLHHIFRLMLCTEGLQSSAVYLGTSPGGDKLGARDMMLNTKVARRAAPGNYSPSAQVLGAWWTCKWQHFSPVPFGMGVAHPKKGGRRLVSFRVQLPPVGWQPLLVGLQVGTFH